LAEAKRDGVAPGSARADELAARHRASIAQFYDCDDEMQRCLVRCTSPTTVHAVLRRRRAGLAQFLHDIVVESLDS
jgi:hypothetical protein